MSVVRNRPTFANIMAVIFISLNGLAGLFAFGYALSEAPIGTVIFISTLVIMSAGLLRRSAQAWLAQAFANRWMIMALAGFYAAMLFALESLVQQTTTPLLWSTVRTWQATLFVWGLACWLIAYARRNFDMDALRQQHWRWLLLTCAVVSLAAVALLAVRPLYPKMLDVMTSHAPFPVSPLLQKMSDQNSDGASFYVPHTRDFPYDLRQVKTVLHRPTVYVFTSQVCLVLDMVVMGYADSSSKCSTSEVAAIAYVVVNILMYAISTLIVYELLRYYVKRPDISLYASLLFAVSPLQPWFITIPSTDYGDTFIIFLSIWILHHIYSRRHHQVWDALFYGLVFGFMLLFKLMAMYFIFAVLLSFILGKLNRVLLMIGVAFLVFAGYAVLVRAFGIPFTVLETQGDWGSIWWVRDVFLPASLYEKASFLSIWFARTFGQSAMLYGGLLLAGIPALTMLPNVPKSHIGLFWLSLISSVLWSFVFKYSYTIHVIGLAPFVYGGTALLCFALRDWLTAHRRTGKVWHYAVLALPMLHNLFLWSVWVSRHEMYYFFWTKVV